ncbi:hypothetical protein ACO22_03953 [Paracoccidioides brasiliensis]|uniref:Uncharacterized protein n=1 Tax=Paracoccidioides brasiliensis TaxID=121759 RepID=A0A1D2JEG6_PARBR|nr:hypothetical protein ACO22_03953 [Paracoccidioides brasiliensis]
MTERISRPPSILLEPPPKGAELEDPGAQSHSESEDEHFSDASEGIVPHSGSRSRSPSPIPRTRVERIDDVPAYGEIPGSPAYEKRELDAVPDEIEIISRGTPSRPSSSASGRATLTPDAIQIPRTVVEKIDPSSPSYGEEPGTPAYETHKADSAPDMIWKVGDQGPRLWNVPPDQTGQRVEGSPVPETVLSRVESPPEDHPHREFIAHKRHPSDAMPDAIVTVPDVLGSSNALSSRSEHRSHVRRKSSVAENQSSENDASQQPAGDGSDDRPFGDDFDDFEEGDRTIDDDDFGDFGEAAFQGPMEVIDEGATQTDNHPILQQPPPPSFPHLLDFDSIKNLQDLLGATSNHLDTLFPSSANLSSLPPVEPFPDASAIFITDRSLSLWSQLVAPPPLQPPNWIKSRIRRLFLVSLGVPVDLDEILPASKQKKLVLPSINFEGSPSPSNTATGGAPSSSVSRVKADGQGRSSTSLDSVRSTSRTRAPRRRGPQPPPELDLLAVRRLCATTDAALDNFTDDELKQHISRLEEMTRRASEVLEYWLKRRDAQIGEKEAFEGVIENLVKHARQVRK